MNDVIPVKTLAVARSPRKVPSSVVAGALGLLGLFVFLIMASSRSATAQEDADLPGLSNASATNASPLPQPAAPVLPLQPVPVAAAGAVPVPTAVSAASPFQSAAAPSSLAPVREAERARPPILIVDFAQAGTSRSAPPAGVAPGAPIAQAERGPQLSNSENFSARVSREDVEMVEAVQLPRLNRLVPQGTMIAAAMETALNSDLPGFARAIVQRDVLSFEGGEVLIPAGSRVIGQYESGVAQGASRVFIVWTRLMRPDGVTIALASPAVDQLGRAGVKGKVNRHFLQRFGGSILLSVLSGGSSALTAAVTQGSSVVVSSPVQASGLAEQAAKDFDIPPTIKTPQGAAVRIFVARDLDFTRVGPMR